jgi:hypothetical protein
MHGAYLNHLKIFASCQSLDTLLDPTFISFIANIFRGQHHCFGNWALMHGSLSPFATRKPPIWCQKNED